jgi:hypothetical protein
MEFMGLSGKHNIQARARTGGPRQSPSFQGFHVVDARYDDDAPRLQAHHAGRVLFLFGKNP